MRQTAARKFAGIVFAVALLTLLMSVWVALVYHGDQDLGANWISQITFGDWIAGFSVLIALCFVLLLILFLVPTQSSEELPPDVDNTLQVSCGNCQKAYVINDPGTRPLYHQCPHCNHTNALEDSPAPPEPEPVQERLVSPRVIERMEGGVSKKFMVLNCGNCRTNFEIDYTENRPIITTCSNCGRRGILK